MRDFSWTTLQQQRLRNVQTVLFELQKYKPLTLRQIYYQLVGKELIENTKSCYTMLSSLLKWARIDGKISWDDVEDRVRVFSDASGYSDKQEYVDLSNKYFLTRYRRDLLNAQQKYVEVWIEKDALSEIFRRICTQYCVSVVVCRGFSSVSFLNDYKKRLSQHANQQAVMLYFGDFDPSGMEMLDAMKKTLTNELDIPEILFRRVALTQEDIEKYHLPYNPDAIKKGDTRASKHILNYGSVAVELDALHPKDLEEKIKNAIESELDMNIFEKEILIEEAEQKEILALKNKVSSVVNEDNTDI